ncbi:alanine--glyoxylate aminotransferase family protein [Ihubacter massiliensis]|uniref:Alanine--glyoxylate aminotransferase family protein n=1 Tax=Hominibacterium faecale TaxID=2839743 RepID=A0A9J6QUW3_9FIRM|nr:MULTISPECIES: alanine--glyoxylate aminotransferase family protein [Eubacteriales Family XIII. Incertae Sedis]MCC2864645.1 alanine--glyoxylate aminotransferase family protein [Anaerovorax odorimutans]MDE8733788.1 alanine--glyoxylate aminotransferase family protein [Eubacteriales bacterium DFI.9.88]MDY3011139.1 alanine--glyoxylate aminotransferase family protein [Clostridiales Family XIII bacterium]MCO7123841.1 alanine--glyoxylate aminotransferase family protein [Ihubacter massiliensis]MCU737
MYKIMTAGPTQVRENVRMARSLETTNPDLDLEFYDFYKQTCDDLKGLLHSSGSAYILGGEGILGLEAACASLTEPGDRVLVIDNGIFGKGFADFVTLYGGQPVLYTCDYKRPVDCGKLREFLEEDSDFKYATLVHCDTPSGVLNDVKALGCLLDEFHILSVVDSVAGMFGEYLNVDESRIDILCGGSQKALSAPPGLTLLWVSDRAIEAMENRSTPIASFYANILTFKNYYKDKWFPYTMPISDIQGLAAAVDNVKADQEIFRRHEKIAAATRQAVTEAGLSLYLKSGYSNTVTVVQVPEGVTDEAILSIMRDKYQVMISGCFDILAGKVIRIGHMGENANIPDMAQTLDAMDKTLQELGVPLKCRMKDRFLELLS